MPVYTCAIRESGLSADIKAALAREMARVNSSVNHVPELGHEQAPTQAGASRTTTQQGRGTGLCLRILVIFSGASMAMRYAA
jgi:hypothetical protein